MAEVRCKKAERGNCGPIKAGDDYCLFHKPGKSKEEVKEFYEKLTEQATKEPDEKGKVRLVFNDDVNWKGYVFVGGIPSSLLWGATFKGKAGFVGATFESYTYFREITFKGEADFRHAIFESGAFFDSNTFKSADFSYATFKGEANFRTWPRTFESCFEDWARFDLATFKGKADFSIIFKKADFVRVTFEDFAGFVGAAFEGRARFSETTFKGKASFLHTTFKNEAMFDYVNLKSEGLFAYATFEGRADFDGATFEGVADFSRLSFKKEAMFKGALFERTCTFKGRKFEGELFFTNTEFRQGVVMEKDWQNPEPEKYKLPQAEQEGCRVQKISYENEGRKEAAEAMFVREMRARRTEKIRSEKKPLWKMPGRYIFYWLEKWAIDKTCKYGTDWYSLFKATLLVIVSFSLIYFLSYFDIGFLGNLGQSSFYSFNFQWSWVLFIELCQALLQSIIFSIVTFTTLGSGTMNPEGLIIGFLVGLQSLIGAFFIALFVVVFARKWMR